MDRNERARIIWHAERLERATKAKGRPSGVLGQTGLALLRVLLFRFGSSPEPSYKALRTATGFAFSTIAGAIKRLEAAGIIFKARRTRKTRLGVRVITNAYRFLSSALSGAERSREAGLIPADVERTFPESFVPYADWKSPVKDALEALGDRIIESTLMKV